MIYKCRYFKIYELVSRRFYQQYGQRAWQFLQIKPLITADRLRERYGKTKINDYRWNGKRQWAGLRTPESPFYSDTSQHSFGNGFDPIFKHVTAEEVREDIVKKPNLKAFEYITAIELDVSWFHFDCRNCVKMFKFSK